jgi:hypothetical protein
MRISASNSVLFLAPYAMFAATMVGCGGKSDPEHSAISVGGAPSSTRPLGTTTTESAGGSTSATVSSPAGGSTSALTAQPAGGSSSGTTTQPSGGTSATSSTSSAGGGATQVTAIPPRVPTVHRAQALTCVGVFSPPDPSISGADDPLEPQCRKHADCTDGANGKCVNGIGMGYRFYSCTYDRCEADADCDAGKICYCSQSTAARCLAIGNCRTDADCGNGPYSYCSPSMSWDCGGYRPVDGFHCHTPSDTCMDDSDCAGTSYCNFDVYQARWKCTETDTTCVIG